MMSRMIKFFGILFLLILLTIPFLIADIYLQNGFLTDFLVNQSPMIMGTILALNLTTATFLMSYLTSIEVDLKKRIFDKSIMEVKHNIILMLIVLPVHLVILTFTPTIDKNTSPQMIFIYYVLRDINLLLFFVYLYALWEIIKAIFAVRKVLVNTKAD